MRPAASISSAIHTVVRGVSVPDALQGDGGTLREVLQEGAEGPSLMADPGLGAQVASLVQNGKLGTACGRRIRPYNETWLRLRWNRNSFVTFKARIRKRVARRFMRWSGRVIPALLKY